MRKYFKLASVWYFLFFLIIIGIKTKRLISKANQVIIHVWDEIINKIENNIVVQNRKVAGCKKIIIWCKTQ